jgi:hypothetical protein
MKNNKLVQINEGEYYLFFNFYKGKQNITLGYPYKKSSRNDVYLKINEIEQDRISYSEASKYLSQSLITVLPIHRVKGIYYNKKLNYSPRSIEKKTYCKLCEKQLRGNLSKVICTNCFNRIGRPEIHNLEDFQKLDRRYFETLDLVLKNYTIEKISHERDLGFSTIVNHLEKLSMFISLKNYTNLKPNEIYINKLKLLIKKIGRDNLRREFYEQLNPGNKEVISFDQIRHCLFYIDHCS